MAVVELTWKAAGLRPCSGKSFVQASNLWKSLLVGSSLCLTFTGSKLQRSRKSSRKHSLKLLSGVWLLNVVRWFGRLER